MESTVSPVIDPALHVEKKSASDSKEEIKEETDEQLANRLKESQKLFKPFRADYWCFEYCRPGRELREADVKEYILYSSRFSEITKPCKKMQKALDQS